MNGSSPCTLATTSNPANSGARPLGHPSVPDSARRSQDRPDARPLRPPAATMCESVATTQVLQLVLHDALDHPGDEGLTGQQLERFVGETGRA